MLPSESLTLSEKHWLFILQGTPYFDPLVTSGLDAAMAAGAFGQKVSVLFTGAGVLQLLAQQSPPADARHVGKTLASFPLYDIENIYVDQRFWEPLVEKALPLEIAPLAPEAIAHLIASADHVMSF